MQLASSRHPAAIGNRRMIQRPLQASKPLSHETRLSGYHSGLILDGITMFRPFELFIGLRYTRAKRRNHFISFISLTSILGIAVGVTALITVLSVMNG
ncbi:MAG: hypothetical protein AB1344_09375, partial [Pseudomonadota bacterium]